MRRKILSIVIAAIVIIGLIVSIGFNIALHNENKKLVAYQDKYQTCSTELAAAYDDNAILQTNAADKDKQIETLQTKVDTLQKQVETLKKN